MEYSRLRGERNGVIVSSFYSTASGGRGMVPKYPAIIFKLFFEPQRRRVTEFLKFIIFAAFALKNI